MRKKLFPIVIISVCLIVFINVISYPSYSNTVQTYVCIEEFDGVKLDIKTIDEFYSDLYSDNAEVIFKPSSLTKENSEDISATFGFVSKEGKTLALGYQYSSVDSAKSDYNNTLSRWACNTISMDSFCIRINEFIFWESGELWEPLIKKIGISIKMKDYSIVNKGFISVEKSKNISFETLKKQLKKYDYKIIEEIQNEKYNIVSKNGDETYTVLVGDAEVKEAKKLKISPKRFLKKEQPDNYFDAQGGITVYYTTSYVVLSRGNSWAKLLNQLAEVTHVTQGDGSIVLWMM